MKPKEKKTRLVIVGGHATPALALVGEVQKQHQDWQIYYLGIKHPFEGKKALSLEYKLVSQEKEVTFIPLTAGRFQRRF